MDKNPDCTKPQSRIVLKLNPDLWLREVIHHLTIDTQSFREEKFYFSLFYILSVHMKTEGA